MSKRIIFLLLAATLAWTAWAQDENPVGETAVEEEVAAEDEATGSAAIEEADEIEEEEEVNDADDGVLDEAFDDLDLDEQTYEEDEDDFIPTEEIPADEPIPFPSNI